MDLISGVLITGFELGFREKALDDSLARARRMVAFLQLYFFSRGGNGINLYRITLLIIFLRSFHTEIGPVLPVSFLLFGLYSVAATLLLPDMLV